MVVIVNNQLQEKTMSQTMQIEIDRAVNKFTPPMEVGGGFLTRDDFKTFARKAVTEGTLIGWAHAENMTRERMQRKITELEHEVTILRDRVKDVEMELLAVQK
jgi:predicted aconitase